MKALQLFETKLHLKNGYELDIIHPKLNYKAGILCVSGLLDENQFNNFKDFKSRIQKSKEVLTDGDLLTITGVNTYMETITISNISYLHIEHNAMKMEFICYGTI